MNSTTQKIVLVTVGILAAAGIILGAAYQAGAFEPSQREKLINTRQKAEQELAELRRGEGNTVHLAQSLKVNTAVKDRYLADCITNTECFIARLDKELEKGSAASYDEFIARQRARVLEQARQVNK